MWIEKILRLPGDNPDKPKTLVMAPTGVAACLIGKIVCIYIYIYMQYVSITLSSKDGTTVQTGLGFNFSGGDYLPLASKKLEFLRTHFEELESVILDEMSMVGADMLYFINRRLQEIGMSEDLFGGKAVLLVGDLMQCPPVQQTKIFKIPSKSLKNATLFNSENNLWNNFEVVSPKINHRQGDGNRFTNLLNNIRIAKSGYFLPDEDIDLLMSRKISNFPQKDFQSDEVCHTYFTNKKVNQYNEKKLLRLESELISVNYSYTTNVENYTPKIKPKGTVADSNFQATLSLKVGAKVMLVFNVDLADSLVNGQMGIVVDFIDDSKSYLMNTKILS